MDQWKPKGRTVGSDLLSISASRCWLLLSDRLMANRSPVGVPECICLFLRQLIYYCMCLNQNQISSLWPGPCYAYNLMSLMAHITIETVVFDLISRRECMSSLHSKASNTAFASPFTHCETSYWASQPKFSLTAFRWVCGHAPSIFLTTDSTSGEENESFNSLIFEKWKCAFFGRDSLAIWTHPC